ncbi:MAG: peptidylprolyl isomerase [Plectolyngbya sp. WJT66-NPBG17]|nr:peptidylprolyl isomerase [Plectolyngbya sp. WJT66-NPBG17]
MFDRQIETHFRENSFGYTQAVLYKVTPLNLTTAQEMYQAIQANEIFFHEVVQRYTQDESRHLNGYWGTFTRSDLPTELAPTIFSANLPQALSPLSTFLIYISKIIQPQLTDTLRSRTLAELFSNWAKQQLDRTEIRLEL